MKLIDLNRDGGIGANSLFVQIGELNVLVDCGLHPKKAGRSATPDLTPLRGKTLDLIIITHCHLDHIGSLPVLLRGQPDAPVIMTTSSRMLIERMLHNSANVMMRQREEDAIPDYPLFTHDEVTTDRRKPTINANGPVYGVTELSGDYITALDPVHYSDRKITIPLHAPNLPNAWVNEVPNPSPYWGDELIWKGKIGPHNPWFDSKGRVFLRSANPSDRVRILWNLFDDPYDLETLRLGLKAVRSIFRLGVSGIAGMTVYEAGTM